MLSTNRSNGSSSLGLKSRYAYFSVSAQRAERSGLHQGVGAHTSQNFGCEPSAVVHEAKGMQPREEDHVPEKVGTHKYCNQWPSVELVLGHMQARLAMVR